jgi:hypothetical protein
MNVILCIFLIVAVIFAFFTLCAFALEAARAALPTYEEPPTAYSYQIDRQTDDLERCVAIHETAAHFGNQHDKWSGGILRQREPSPQDGRPLEPR